MGKSTTNTMRIKKIITTSIATAITFLPLLTRAQTEIEDPLGINGNPFELWGRLVKAFVGIIGAPTLFFFVYGGFLFLTSGGNDEKIKKGKDTLMWATIGLAVVLGAYTILTYIISVVTTSTKA